MAATLQQIAKAAGVSITTASVVLNRGKQFERISDECVRRVTAVADRLGYVPNYQARSVRTGRSDVLGVVFEFGGEPETDTPAPRLATHYADEILAGAEAAATRRGFMVLRIRRTPERTAVDRGIRSVQGKRVDGLIVPGVYRGVNMTDLLNQAPDLPIVIVEPRADTALPSVTFDDAAGVRLLVEHLVSLGHRRLLWLAPPFAGLPGTLDRGLVARESAAARGATCGVCDLPALHGSGFLPENQIAMADAAMTACLGDQAPGAPPFTAVVAYNDTVAIGAMRALARRGLRVPADVSVVGYDDLQAIYTLPPLTTIDHRLYDLGERAGELILRMIAGGAAARKALRDTQETIEPRLVVRESTAPPAH